jgi:ABC transporter substrate binding protein (PQQ-dependent alcohol dehydrogenase system)
VDDKPWTFVEGARRSDTGHFAVEAEVARFTQGIGYDILVVADEANDFAYELPYHATDPRPVAGSAGMVPTAWSGIFEQWGATQLQLRFRKAAGRKMTALDGNADLRRGRDPRAVRRSRDHRRVHPRQGL